MTETGACMGTLQCNVSAMHLRNVSVCVYMCANVLSWENQATSAVYLQSSVTSSVPYTKKYKCYVENRVLQMERTACVY